jgi:hypothetical protein
VGIVITGLLWMVTAKPRPDYSMELFEVRLGSRISRMDAGAMDAIYAGNAREGAVRLAEVAAAENLLLPEKQSHEPFGPSPTEMRALREFERCGEARIYAAFLRLKYPQWQWERQPGSGAE